jgi:NADH-quinone oxidoreductase subunit H
LSLIERNRAPFDLLEGERELIRGFNVEIGSSMFVLLFLREYGILIVIAGLTNLIIFGEINFFRIILVVFILFIRSCFPRIRYDSLMGLI